MEDTDETLTSRQKTHGLWRQTAGCCHAIKEAMNIWRTANLSATQKETLDQLAVKMARICCGDPNEPDHWDESQAMAATRQTSAAALRQSKPLTYPTKPLTYPI